MCHNSLCVCVCVFICNGGGGGGECLLKKKFSKASVTVSLKKIRAFQNKICDFRFLFGSLLPVEQNLFSAFHLCAACSSPTGK